MEKGRLAAVIIGVLLAGILSGCATFTGDTVPREKEVKKAWLGWFAYYDRNNAVEKEQKKAYRIKVADYIQAHPEIRKEDAENMRSCYVTLGMKEEQVLLR